MRFTPLILAIFLLFPLAALAAVPTTMLVEGQLVAASGQTVPDGKYSVTFRLYDAPSAGNVLWQEGPDDVQLSLGLFAQTLGAKTPLTAEVLANGAAWLSLQVASDTELPRQPLAAMPFALRAAVAEKLECSGCVTGAMLEAGLLKPYATTQSLDQYVLTTALSAYVTQANLAAELAAYVKTAQLSKVAFSGQYADLLGLPGASSLPPDGISAASNGLLSNVFATTYTHGALDLGIKDCYGLGVTDSITLPDVGLAQEITVNFAISNSDISGISVTLIDPMGTPYVLYDKGQTGKSLTSTFNASKSAFGKWLGANPKGDWTLKVVDSVCGPGGTDGAINNWNIAVKAVSSSALQAKGDLLVGNLLAASGLISVKSAIDFGSSVTVKGVPLVRIWSVQADGLADGAFVDLQTGGSDVELVASAWVNVGGGWQQISGVTDGSCSACGDGGEGDFTANSSMVLSGNNHQFANFTLNSSATLTPTAVVAAAIPSGGEPAIIRVAGTATISGAIVMDGGDVLPGYYTAGEAGAGGGTRGGSGTSCSSAGSPGSGGGGGSAGTGNCGGTGNKGGGGSHAVPGNASGNGAIAAAYGGANLPAGLEVGSGGGAGGGCDSGSGQGGGGGGGALLLIAKKIVITNTGKISANGGMGGYTSGSCQGAGGGGSGGTIWLRAQSVVVDGSLTVNGGVLAGTAAGSPGRIRIDGTLSGAWTPPSVADLSQFGSFYQGDATVLGPPSVNRFPIAQFMPGAVRLTNNSGSTQNIRLVVMR